MSDADDAVTVRRYRPGDGAAVRRLHERALCAEGVDPSDIAGIDDLRDVEASFLDAGGEFLVAELDGSQTESEPGAGGGEADGEIVATGGLAVDRDDLDLDDGEGELLRIAVDPDHQRRGLGTAIVEGLEDAARERGLERLVLTTAQRQAAATEFYPSRGYEAFDREWVRGYQLVHFEKRLD